MPNTLALAHKQFFQRSRRRRNIIKAASSRQMRLRPPPSIRRPSSAAGLLRLLDPWPLFSRGRSRGDDVRHSCDACMFGLFSSSFSPTDCIARQFLASAYARLRRFVHTYEVWVKRIDSGVRPFSPSTRRGQLTLLLSLVCISGKGQGRSLSRI